MIPSTPKFSSTNQPTFNWSSKLQDVILSSLFTLSSSNPNTVVVEITGDDDVWTPSEVC